MRHESLDRPHWNKPSNSEVKLLCTLYWMSIEIWKSKPKLHSLEILSSLSGLLALWSQLTFTESQYVNRIWRVARRDTFSSASPILHGLHTMMLVSCVGRVVLENQMHVGHSSKLLEISRQKAWTPIANSLEVSLPWFCHRAYYV